MTTQINKVSVTESINSVQVSEVTKKVTITETNPTVSISTPYSNVVLVTGNNYQTFTDGSNVAAPDTTSDEFTFVGTAPITTTVSVDNDNVTVAATLDTDLSSVSGSDDTLASAKAIKTYVDSKSHLALLDEDDMNSDSATSVPSQQSVKAYVDAQDANIASDTLIFTNKTFDVEATGNSISNIDVADLKSGVLDTNISSVSGSDDTLASAKAIKTQLDTKQASLTHGIADTNTVKIDSVSVAENEFAYFTASGLESLSTSETLSTIGGVSQTAYDFLNGELDDHVDDVSNPHTVTKAQVGLTNAEDTALSTWAGTTNVTTVGAIGTGTWESTDVAVAHGGTGASTHTANSVLVGAGTSSITSIAPGADGQVLTSTGTVWQSEAPSAGGVSEDDVVALAIALG